MGNAATPQSIDAVRTNIRAEMARRSLTQSALADRLGISQPSLSKRLSGQTEIEVRDLLGIADALGVAPADLLTPAAASSPGAAGGPALPGG
jgi:transcriptional regulator with XRE-family HTH domain